MRYLVARGRIVQPRRIWATEKVKPHRGRSPMRPTIPTFVLHQRDAALRPFSRKDETAMKNTTNTSETRRFIPNGVLRRLNRVAERHGKRYMSDDCPVLNEGESVPVLRAFSGIDSAGWVRCEVPATPDCTVHVFLDVRLEDFGALPFMGELSEKRPEATSDGETICENLMSPSNLEDRPGFIFVPSIHHDKPAETPPPVVAPAPHYPDDIRSANARMDWGTHVAEPVYKDGKVTGEWRVARLRSRSDRPGKDVPWETVFSNREAAMDWARDLTTKAL